MTPRNQPIGTKYFIYKLRICHETDIGVEAKVHLCVLKTDKTLYVLSLQHNFDFPPYIFHEAFFGTSVLLENLFISQHQSLCVSYKHIYCWLSLVFINCMYLYVHTYTFEIWLYDVDLIKVICNALWHCPQEKKIDYGQVNIDVS